MRPLLATLGAALLAVSAQAQYLGPSSYLQISDSPFFGGTYQYFHLENFEDGQLNTPGVTANAGMMLGPAALTDSVDGDDGVVDGDGTRGHSWYSNGARLLRFDFAVGTLGALPTHVGLVWTDVGFTDSGLGFGDVVFEAFGAGGNSLGVLSANNLGDGLAGGGTPEDRFFGIVDLGGVSRIEMTMPASSDWEVDHLQYGAVPEPGTLIALGGALAGLLCRRRRRR